MAKPGGMAAHDNPDFRALCLEIGGTTVASATLEHVVLIMAATCRGPREMAPDDRRRRLGQLRDDLAEGNRDNPADAVLVNGWIKRTSELLGRRDRIVHVLWQHDPEHPTGAHGVHIKSGERVTLDTARKLVDDLRVHVLASELVYPSVERARALQATDG